MEMIDEMDETREVEDEEIVEDPKSCVSIFDLAALDTTDSSEAGRWMQVINPDNDEEIPGLRLLVYGEDSKRYTSAMDAVGRAKAEKARLSRNKKSNDGRLAYSELKEAAVIIATKLTKDWEGVMLNGVVLVCNQPNKEKIFGRFEWLADQVVRFSRERSNFLA